MMRQVIPVRRVEFSSTKKLKKHSEKAVLQGTWRQWEAAESVMGTVLIQKTKKRIAYLRLN